MASLLLAKGAAVDAKNNDGETPLRFGLRIYNCRNEKEEATFVENFTLLLGKGAAVDVKDKNSGRTPLHEGFRIRKPSTSNSQLLTLKPSALNS